MAGVETGIVEARRVIDSGKGVATGMATVRLGVGAAADRDSARLSITG